MALTIEQYNALLEKANKAQKAKPTQHESNLQKQCVKWFRLCYPDLLLFSVPNGGSRNKIEASRLKQEGVLAGVSDLILLLPNKDYHALCIEMKYGKNGQSENQKIFERKVKEFGYKYVVADSFDKFREIISEYLNNHK